MHVFHFGNGFRFGRKGTSDLNLIYHIQEFLNPRMIAMKHPQALPRPIDFPGSINEWLVR